MTNSKLFMITLKVTDLEQQNISVKKDSEITFEDKVYQKQKVLSKRDEDKIAQIVEEYSSNNSEVIVVEHKLFFSIWIDKKVETITETANTQQSTKKIIKKYRGISYEIEVPENDHENNAVAIQQRKYRGKSY
ncbi:MAG: hypothetical protein AB4372_01185 [Xenococcus sp. (in: cyanobacteria)]